MRTTLCVSLAASLLLAGAGLLSADDEAAVRAVLDKAIKAHGGAEKLAKFKASTTKMKGKFHGSGTPIDYTGEIIIQLPDKSKITIEGEVMGQKFSFSQVFVGGKGWELNSFEGKPQDLDKDKIEEAREGLYAHEVATLAPLTGKGFTLSPVGESKIGDRPATGVRVSGKGHRDINLYFDKDKGLLLKMEKTVKDLMAGGKEMQEEIFYSDFKEVEGVQQPMKVVIKRDSKDYVEGETTDLKLAEKLDDSVFAKP